MHGGATSHAGLRARNRTNAAALPDTRGANVRDGPSYPPPFAIYTTHTSSCDRKTAMNQSAILRQDRFTRLQAQVSTEPAAARIPYA